MQTDMLPIVDAGGSTLTRMILEEAAGQIAKENKVEPAPEAVTAYAKYQTRYDANKRRAIEQGVVTVADFEPVARYNMETLAIGTDGAKPKPEDMKKMYDSLVTQPAVSQGNPMTGQPGQNNPVKSPAELTIKVIPAKDEATATKILAQLKTNDDFKAAAQTAGMTGPALDTAGQETPVPNLDALKAQSLDIYNALTQTPAGQYVSKPVPVPSRDPKGPKNYFVIKVIKNTPEVVFTMDEARPALEQLVLNTDKPDWNDHQTTLINDRLQKMLTDGSIQINIPRYENIKTKVLPLLIEDAKKAIVQRAAMRAQQAQQAQMQAQMQAQQQAQQKNNPPANGGKPNAPRPVTPAPKPNGKP